MEYKLILLSIYQTNWPAYIELYQDIFDISPTRILDENNVPLDKPVALQKSLSHNFREADAIISLSFAGTANADMLIELMNKTTIRFISKESTNERNLFLFLANATLADWKDAIINLESSKNKSIQRLQQSLITLIKMTGYY